ncbi:uncharacterized protein LOC116413417 [Galleria mellonella]|uniref:Uncharacterized protein LOC116413417 n=1 Tax=Galleria mellonella TaxID=7137 RepID=A0A6J3C6V4_GALME|nr:uncharacterized protein LOC116413417 [Galleria mellonella]
MKMLILFNIFVLFIHNINSVPPDYCLHSINVSDCSSPPKPVYYYYKPGSRCEITFWRGCFTYNKFDTEYACSHTCIGRFGSYNDSDENTIVSDYVWYSGVFTTEKSETFEQWINELSKLSEDNVTIINNILDSLSEDDQEPAIVKLKYIKANIETTTETTITTSELIPTEVTNNIEITTPSTESLTTKSSTIEPTTTAELVVETTTATLATTTETTTRTPTTETTTRTPITETTTRTPTTETTTRTPTTETTTRTPITETTTRTPTTETTTRTPTTEIYIGDAQEVITT